MTSPHESQARSESFWTRSRWVAALVFLAVMTTGLWVLAASPPRALAMILTPAVAGLFCVWFPGYLGGFKGRAGLVEIGDPTPESVVYWAGWCLLLLPLPLSWLAT